MRIKTRFLSLILSALLLFSDFDSSVVAEGSSSCEPITQEADSDDATVLASTSEDNLQENDTTKEIIEDVQEDISEESFEEDIQESESDIDIDEDKYLNINLIS